jgi:alpha-aminoadipic semialdehyde synthase
MYSYANVASAFAAVKACGDAIAEFGLPREICPLTVVVTSNGKVASGAMEVWSLLPHEIVDPFSLRELVSSNDQTKTRKIFLTTATAEHMVRKMTEASPNSPLCASSPSTSPRSSPSSSTFSLDVTSLSPSTLHIPDDVDVNRSSFDKQLYKAHPELYEPIFHIKVFPYASVICNCMYWENKFPRLLTIDQTKTLAASHRLRLLGLTDISCDFKGSIEFLREFTSIEKPFLIYDLENDVFHAMKLFIPREVIPPITCVKLIESLLHLVGS